MRIFPKHLQCICSSLIGDVKGRLERDLLSLSRSSTTERDRLVVQIVQPAGILPEGTVAAWGEWAMPGFIVLVDKLARALVDMALEDEYHSGEHDTWTNRQIVQKW